MSKSLPDQRSKVLRIPRCPCISIFITAFSFHVVSGLLWMLAVVSDPRHVPWCNADVESRYVDHRATAVPTLKMQCSIPSLRRRKPRSMSSLEESSIARFRCIPSPLVRFEARPPLNGGLQHQDHSCQGYEGLRVSTSI